MEPGTWNPPVVVSFKIFFCLAVYGLFYVCVFFLKYGYLRFLLLKGYLKKILDLKILTSVFYD